MVAIVPVLGGITAAAAVVYGLGCLTVAVFRASRGRDSNGLPTDDQPLATAPVTTGSVTTGSVATGPVGAQPPEIATS